MSQYIYIYMKGQASSAITQSEHHIGARPFVEHPTSEVRLVVVYPPQQVSAPMCSAR